VKRSFRLVPNARFYGIPSLGFRFDRWAGIPSPSLWNRTVKQLSGQLHALLRKDLHSYDDQDH
jgi:hypothetical protein